MDDIRDKKERLAMNEYYDHLQDVDHDRQLPRAGGQPFAQQGCPRRLASAGRPGGAYGLRRTHAEVI